MSTACVMLHRGKKFGLTFFSNAQNLKTLEGNLHRIAKSRWMVDEPASTTTSITLDGGGGGQEHQECIFLLKMAGIKKPWFKS